MNSLIGPHEGKEFQLLDHQQKHVALFYDIIPDDYYLYREKDNFDFFEFSKPALRHSDNVTISIPYVILFRKTHIKEAERLKKLLSSQSITNSDDSYATEKEIGLILGYPDEAIDFYINRLKEISYEI